MLLVSVHVYNNTIPELNPDFTRQTLLSRRTFAGEQLQRPKDSVSPCTQPRSLSLPNKSQRNESLTKYPSSFARSTVKKFGLCLPSILSKTERYTFEPKVKSW